ncbi:hypothetical protein E2562_012747 [Oryza meyeriana var. granulata]|uniref:Uncharacterized protein n=1 Tax=Oryza meyeriana var. granulata TaxID=110450 RepID=A0A6G1DHQ2_9ORYZ|nr:hypothetical protein E2562_012747 [Oryza meyeriana var. granulata]
MVPSGLRMLVELREKGDNGARGRPIYCSQAAADPPRWRWSSREGKGLGSEEGKELGTREHGGMGGAKLGVAGPSPVPAALGGDGLSPSAGNEQRMMKTTGI